MRPLGDEAGLAELTYRLITTQQLRHDQHLSARQIRYRVDHGSLHPVFPGVYSLDPNVDGFLVRAIALCLKYPVGFLSGAAAARYWHLRKGIPDHLEFTVPDTVRPHGCSPVQFRFARGIEDADFIQLLDGLRVSAPARSVFEAAGRLDGFGLRSMIHDGVNKGLFTADSLAREGARLCTSGRRGSRLFRAVVALAEDEAAAQSEEELVLLDALRSIGLHVIPQHPLLLPNGATIHFDIGIPDCRVGLEVDGPTHGDPITVHRDKSRDLMVAAVDWQSLRIPTADIRSKLRVVTAYVDTVCARRRLHIA